MGRIFHYILDIILFIWVIGPLRIAAAASAVVILSVTILKPSAPDQEISVSPHNLDLTGRTSGELVVSNHTSGWREIRIDLIPSAENAQECQLLYSPSLSTIAPQSTQMVRVLVGKPNEHPCQINHKLIITYATDAHPKRIEVPMTSLPENSL